MKIMLGNGLITLSIAVDITIFYEVLCIMGIWNSRLFWWQRLPAG